MSDVVIANSLVINQLEDVVITRVYSLSGNVNIVSSGRATSIVAWGDITGTLSSQTDLQTALNSKVNVVQGKQLSTEDFTTQEKTKLANLNNYSISYLNGKLTIVEA